MRPGTTLVSRAALAAALASAGAARADLVADGLGPRELATGEARRAEATGGQAVSLNPAGLALNREMAFEGSYGYRQSDRASLVGLSACDSTNLLPGCFYYRYAGGDTPDDRHQRSHVAGISLARMIGSRGVLGVDARYVNIAGQAADGSEDVKGINADLGLTLRLTDQLTLAGVGYHLVGTRNASMPRTVAAGIGFRPLPDLLAAFDARWDLDTDGETGRYGGGAEYFLATASGQTGYPVRGGVVYDVAGGTYVTGGLGLATVKFAIDVGARKQVADGDELQVIGSLRVFGPRM
ncbi:MAG: hypothetical protein KBG48_14280 [Kofleriaceae bacterium]|jgi:hypothetical protein|nr:hypothetical protein [Kofleriaceae bacterium]MBP9168559.1 hypothetical protein [Kofleriaceae bacterium]MBP9859241.1 hypothetical protein [Kofleriaceae bacterium]